MMASLPVKKSAGGLSPELKQRVHNRVAHFIQLGSRLFGINLPMPEIGFDLRGVRAATAQSGKVCKLRFNAILLSANEADYFSNTIPHEVAHLIVGAKWGFDVLAHGYEWQSVMREFGCEPLTTHNYDVSKARVGGTFLYRCACKTHQLSLRRHNTIQRGQRWQCLRCKAELTWVKEPLATIEPICAAR